MKSLYESLLDDEDDLMNKSNNIHSQHIQNWVNTHISKYKGRVTINKKLELSIKNTSILDITGPFPEWLKFAPNNNTESVTFHKCTEAEIERFLDNVVVNSGITIDETFPGKDLSIFNKRFNSLIDFTIIPGDFLTSKNKMNLQYLILDFPVDRFSCRVDFNYLKTINISKVNKSIHWVNYPMSTLEGFPKKVNEDVYVNSIMDIKDIKDLEVVHGNLMFLTQNSSYVHDISNILNMNLNNIHVGGKLSFNSVLIPQHLLKSNRRNDLEAWVVFMMVNKCHDLTLFNEYVKKHGGKEINFDDMKPKHNYIIVDKIDKNLIGINEEYGVVWDANYYSALSEKNGDYSSFYHKDYNINLGPNMNMDRIERFKKEHKSRYDNNHYKIIECSKGMKPLINMEWRGK